MEGTASSNAVRVIFREAVALQRRASVRGPCLRRSARGIKLQVFCEISFPPEQIPELLQQDRYGMYRTETPRARAACWAPTRSRQRGLQLDKRSGESRNHVDTGCTVASGVSMRRVGLATSCSPCPGMRCGGHLNKRFVPMRTGELRTPGSTGRLGAWRQAMGQRVQILGTVLTGTMSVTTWTGRGRPGRRARRCPPFDPAVEDPRVNEPSRSRSRICRISAPRSRRKIAAPPNASSGGERLIADGGRRAAGVLGKQHFLDFGSRIKKQPWRNHDGPRRAKTMYRKAGGLHAIVVHPPGGLPAATS